MRIRSIKPEFWRSSDISELEIEDRLLFVGLWSYVDDNGVGLDKLSAITADLFADDLEKDPQDTFARVSRGLANLSARGRILRYTLERVDYLSITNWSKHQRIDRPGKPRLPQYDAEFASIRESVASVPVNASPGTGEQRIREQGNRGTEDQSLVTSRTKPTSAKNEKTNTALRIVHGWTNAITGSQPPTRTINDVTAQVQALVHDGINPEHISAGLTEWWQGEYPPSTIPNYVTKHSHNRGQNLTASDRRLQQGRQIVDRAAMRNQSTENPFEGKELER